MASRETSYYWRNMVNSMGKNRSFVSSTTPKMKAYAPTHGYNNSYSQQNQVTKPRRRAGWMNGQFVPRVCCGGIDCVLVDIRGLHCRTPTEIQPFSSTEEEEEGNYA